MLTCSEQNPARMLLSGLDAFFIDAELCTEFQGGLDNVAARAHVSIHRKFRSNFLVVPAEQRKKSVGRERARRSAAERFKLSFTGKIEGFDWRVFDVLAALFSET